MDIPDKYRDLLQAKGPTILSVLAKDRSIQSSLVWSDFEAGIISINMLGSAPKLKRIVNSAKATVLKIHADDEDSYICIRCSLLSMEKDGAIEHLNMLTRRHMGVESWYGNVVAENPIEQNDRCIVMLRPQKIYFT